MSADHTRKSVAVVISGSGTNLQALIDGIAAGTIDAEITAVISDQPNAFGLERARAANIEARHIEIPPRSQTGYDLGLLQALSEIDPDLIVLAGFMRILSPALIAAFGDRTINIHPSLLPRHRGLDTHRRVLEAGDSEHGATVHFVSAELDAGPRIIQYRFEVAEHDTEESLTARVHTGEYIILPKAVEWFAAGRLSLVDGRVMLDGAFLREPVIVEER